LGSRSAKWYALVPAVALSMSLPLYVGAFLQSGWRATAVLLGVAGFFQYISFGPTFGVIQNVVAVRRRATATALIYVLLSVVALAGGALFTGWLIDHLAQFEAIEREDADHLHEARREDLFLGDAETKFGCEPVHSNQFSRNPSPRYTRRTSGSFESSSGVPALKIFPSLMM